MENLLSAVPGNRGDSLAGSLRGRRYWRRDEDAAIARARVLLERFGLSGYADTYGGDLSGGQRRLTEIMRALMTEPTMLLLDEPMAGVHPRLARQIGAQLLDLCAEGMTILMVEHELAIMDEFCDPVIMMAEGAVLATGTMTDLRARTGVVEAYLVGGTARGVRGDGSPRKSGASPAGRGRPGRVRRRRHHPRCLGSGRPGSRRVRRRTERIGQIHAAEGLVRCDPAVHGPGPRRRA